MLIELFWLVAIILIVGAVLWGLAQLPIDATFALVARVLLIVVVVIYAITVLFGLLTGSPLLPRVR